MARAPAPNAIPLLNQPQMSLNFGRMDSDLTIVDHVVQIENQNTLSALVYNQFRSISSIELTITEEHFKQIWKTILLSRVQKVLEREKQKKEDEHLDIDETIIMPAPLADTVSALGSFDSTASGHIHHIIPPPVPLVNRVPVQEPYRVIDDEILCDWSQVCARMQHHYTMKTMPDPDDYEKRPIVLTYVEQTQAPVAHTKPRLIRIKSYTNEPTPNEALIRTVNDDLFVSANEWTASRCSFYMTPTINQQQITATYVGAYVLESNA